MIRQPYANFVAMFSDLNPYELGHIAETLMVKLEDILADSEKQIKMSFSLQDINFAFTRAMRDISVELAESQMADAERQLERTQISTFKAKRMDQVVVSRKQKMTPTRRDIRA